MFDDRSSPETEENPIKNVYEEKPPLNLKRPLNGTLKDHSNGKQGFKTANAVVSGPNTPALKSPIPPSIEVSKNFNSAAQWVLEKTKQIQDICALLENMPIEYKSTCCIIVEILSKEIPQRTPKLTPKPSPLDSLLDQAFDNTANAQLEEKNAEIQSLKSQLASMPSAETVAKLQEEIIRLKKGNEVNRTAQSVDLEQLRTDRDNAVVIFSHLKLPNLAAPTADNLSQFLASLRSVLERTS
jgi:hypothetical protein